MIERIYANMVKTDQTQLKIAIMPAKENQPVPKPLKSCMNGKPASTETPGIVGPEVAVDAGIMVGCIKIQYYLVSYTFLPIENSRLSPPSGPIYWMPTGSCFPSCSTVPIGNDSVGTPVRLTGTVKIS